MSNQAKIGIKKSLIFIILFSAFSFVYVIMKIRVKSIQQKSFYLVTLIIVFLTMSFCSQAEKLERPASVVAASDLTGRIIPKHAKKFIFEEISTDKDSDVFELESGKGKIIIRGNNGVSMAMGLNWYLKEYCNCNVSLNGNNLKLPKKLPEIDGVVRKESWAEYRYFLNYCAFGYSLPWWDWPQWERLIDFMALNGVNAPLAVTGQEATWQAVYKRLGLSNEAIQSFFAGPPYLPFGWMGCLDGWGGPLSQSWIDEHEELAKKILSRERELGMKPIQQGFTGHVPAALASKYPEANINTVEWVEWSTHLMDPLDPLFQKVADIFMEEQTKKYGTDNLYAADAFIEMIPPGGEPEYLQNLSKAIYNGMGRHDPKAIWVFQTWPFHFQSYFWSQPRIKAFLDAIPDEKMLCLDLACEYAPQWKRTNSFEGKPWLWCHIQNFGNKVFLGAKLDLLNKDIVAVRQDSARGKLRGCGFVNEGLGYNPVVQDLMFEMAWQNKEVEMDSWLKRYAKYRYGTKNRDTEKAWEILEETAYSQKGDDFAGYSSVTRGPGLHSNQEVSPFYENARLAEA